MAVTPWPLTSHHKIRAGRNNMELNPSMTTLHEIFVNGSVPPERLYGPFGVCYVAFAGSHEVRYRGEALLEAAARQLTAAASARGATIPQCVMTDQPARKRPYVQLSLPLRTPLDLAPFASLCERYLSLFKRPCKLLFGYMAKAIAVARAPYATTIFLDTDTFVCDAVPLLALGTRVMASYDVALLLPRTTQGWTNSGVLAVRRESVRGWAMAWQREFTSLDDFGDQLHLLKVLPSRTDDADHPSGRRRLGIRRPRTRGALSVGELPAELHVRVGSVAAGAQLKLPPLRGAPMLLHSKGLASQIDLGPWLAAMLSSSASSAASFGSLLARDGDDAAQRQLLGVLSDGQPVEKNKGVHAPPYSTRVLAGMCALLRRGWTATDGVATRQFVLNSAGNCTGCRTLESAPGSIGLIISDAAPAPAPARGNEPHAEPYLCTGTAGECGVQPAVWPLGTERGLPPWYKAWLERQRG